MLFPVYTGNGSTRQFAVTFPYLSKSHVKALVNGVEVGFTWLSPSSVQLDTAPASGAQVYICRETPVDTQETAFSNGNVLTAEELNRADLQLLYHQQEVNEKVDRGVDVEAARVAADAAKVSAQASADTATTKASEASTSAATATTKASEASTSAATATTKASEAASSASSAAASASSASSSASTATTKASEASTSAANASTSATNAANSASSAAASAAAAANSAAPTEELIRDTMALALVAGSGVTITPNDAADTITIAAVTPSVSFASLTGNATDNTSLANALNGKASLTGATFTGKVTTTASASGGAGFNLPHGAAPTTPVNGDLWTTTLGIFVRYNGGSYQLAPVGHTHVIADITSLQTTLNAKADLAGATYTGKVNTAASAAGGAGLNLPHGAAPTSPVNGDLWTTTTAVFARVSGVTVELQSARPPSPPTITASFTAADADNNTHKILGGSAQTLTLNSTPQACTSFTARTTAAWTVTCSSLSKNGAAPVANGSIAANSLVTFFHEGGGTWLVSGNGIT